MGRPGVVATGSLCGTRFIDSIGCKREHRGDACALDGVLELALMQGAGPRDTARKDLPPLRDKLLEHLHVFVVDVLDLLDAELADALPAVEELLLPALRATRTTRSGTTAAATTFAARTTTTRKRRSHNRSPLSYSAGGTPAAGASAGAAPGNEVGEAAPRRTERWRGKRCFIRL